MNVRVGSHQTRIPRKEAGPFQVARGPIVCPLVLSIALSCGPGDLTRERAKAILNADSHFTPAQSVEHRLANQFVHAQCANSGHGWPLPKDAEYPRVVVDVTGITMNHGEPNQRLVEFTCDWKVDAVPPPVADCLLRFSQRWPGKAVFQLYDDGWRVVEASCVDGVVTEAK